MNTKKLALLLLGITFCTSGCTVVRDFFKGERLESKVTKTRVYKTPPAKDTEALVIRFSDDDGFDSMLHSAIQGGESNIVIETNATSTKEFDKRLLRWVGAWQQGGNVEDPHKKDLFTADAVISGIAILNSPETAKLIENLSGWFADQRIRQDRIELLEPYNIKWHSASGDTMKWQLYNGNYETAELSDVFHNANAADIIDAASAR